MAVTGPPVYKYDTLITGGHVIDPANGVDGPADVAILDGRIAGCLDSQMPGVVNSFPPIPPRPRFVLSTENH